MSLKFPRMTEWAVITIVLLAVIAALNPVQLPVVIYKSCLVTLAVVLGYWLDRRLFPYARPHLKCPRGSAYHTVEISTAAALLMLRRALIVFAVIVGMTLGL